jgi:hypothetical protein
MPRTITCTQWILRAAPDAFWIVDRNYGGSLAARARENPA